jgi:FAD/FMN-containing dehydrogenase
VTTTPHTPEADGTTWTNWVGNQSFVIPRVAHPASEDEAAELLTDAATRGEAVSVVGSGHSFTPIVETDGLLLTQRALRGIVCCDRSALTVTALGGTLISDFGSTLWDAGLALANQGDVDSQTIAGSVATGTHGSGIGLVSLSAAISAVRLITAQGEVVEVSGSDADLLRAAQVSVGTLGMLTELTLDVVDAYRLDEEIAMMSVDEVLDGWEHRMMRHRHFSFFWLPSAGSAALYGLASEGDARDQCFVKLYDIAEEGAAPRAGHRVDRAYRIYPAEMERNFDELEYMVPADAGKQAFLEVRAMMRDRFPESVFPLEVRFTAGDRGMLSPNYGRDSVSISVSGRHGTDYWPFLRAVDEVLDRLDGRPHWGKLHFLTRDRVDRLYPEAERFREIRRELDPDGRLLNDSLRPLLR